MSQSDPGSDYQFATDRHALALDISCAQCKSSDIQPAMQSPSPFAGDFLGLERPLQGCENC